MAFISPNPLGITPSVLVGRDRELDVLTGLFEETLRGHGRLVLVSGKAGIGKTALLATFTAELTIQGVSIAIGRCHDLAETPPYGPWHELFRHAARLPDCPPLPAAFASPEGVGPVTSQAILFAEIRELLLAVTEQHPLVCVLDDMHWGDHVSLDLLRFLAPLASRLPLLLIVAFRSDELPPDDLLMRSLPTLVREAQPVRISLQRLTQMNIQSLVRSRYDLPAASEQRLVALLAERAEGNPFFTTELLHTIEEERILIPTDTGWLLGDLASLRVPMMVRQVIEQLLLRLDAEGKRLLTLASVIGLDVPFSVWAAVARVPEETLLDLADRARTAHLIEERGDGSGIRFVHALTRQTLYEQMLVARRRRMHQAVADMLLTAPEPDVEGVAHHLKEAGDPRASQWLTRAGLRAQRTCAWQTAADRYRAALALLAVDAATMSERGWLTFALGRVESYVPLTADEHLKEAEQLAVVGNDRALAAVVAYYRSLSLYHSGDVCGGIAGMERVVAALGSLAESERAILRERQEWIGRALDEDDGAGQLAYFLVSAGHLAQARALAERIIGAAYVPDESNQGPELSHADTSLASAFIAMQYGMPDVARQAVRRAWQACDDLAAYDEAARAVYNEALWIDAVYCLEDADERAFLQCALLRAWQKTSVSLLPYASDDLVRLPLAGIAGNWEMVRQYAAGLPLGTVTLEIVPRSVLASVAYSQGETDLVWRLVYDEVLPDGPKTEPGGTIYLTACVLLRLAARMAMDADDLAAARAWLEAHDRWLAWSGATLGQAEGALLWARYHRLGNDSKLSEEQAHHALALATMPRQPLVLIAAHCLLSEIATERGRYVDADRHLDEATTLADACGAPYERAVTLLARAELRAATLDYASALTLVEETRAICLPLGARPALLRAELLVTRLTMLQTETVVSRPADLTGREVEVLRLLASGSSNREIGVALGITMRTAERHISNIYTKIGVYGRAEAATYAVRQDLV